MSYYEAEKFETTDYDLELESAINSSTRRFTKHQQIHGIWADESRDESGGGTSSSASFRGAADGKGYSYTAPVNFVSAGMQQEGEESQTEFASQRWRDADVATTSRLIESAPVNWVSAGIQQAGKESRTGFGSQRWREADIATTSRHIESAPVNWVSAGIQQAGKKSRTGFGSQRGRGADIATSSRFIQSAPARWVSAGMQQAGKDIWIGCDSERGRGADIATTSRLIQSAPVGLISDGTQQLGKESRTVRLVSAGIQQEGKDSWTDLDPHRWRGADITSTSSDGHEGSGLEFQQHSQVNSFVAGDIAGLRTKQASAASTSVMQKGVGSWGKPKKGPGAKIMFKMGFQQGKGIGKDLQGIVAPIEDHVRHGRGAIDAG